jgi:hypothetical protein
MRLLCASIPVECSLLFPRHDLNSQLYNHKISSNPGSLRRTYNAVFLPKFAAPGRLRYSSRVQPHLKFTEAQGKYFIPKIQARGFDPVTSHLILARLRDYAVLVPSVTPKHQVS